MSGTQQFRDREQEIATAKFHRAHVIEVTYFSLLVATTLVVISFFVPPEWAWFLRGGLLGLAATLAYVFGRTTYH